MSLFGESATDKRDFRMGLAGLQAGLHSLRILAERGLASASDIRISREGIEAVLATIPEEEFGADQRGRINALLEKIEASAALNYGRSA